MKITQVKTIGLRWECPVMSDAMSVCRARQAVWVRIETDSGIYGLGEAFCFGSPLVVAKHIIEDQLSPTLIGQDPTNIDELWHRMYWRNVPNGRTGLVMGCISGVDIALWDILGKVSNKPVVKLLGQHSDRVPSYASGGFYAPGKGRDGLRKELEGYRKLGYRDMKIKIGRNASMKDNAVNFTSSTEFSVSYEEDLKRLELAREIIGKEGRLACDTNAAWTAEKVLASYADLKSVGLNWFEEPILFEDMKGLKEMRVKMKGIAIMGFETIQTWRNYKIYLDQETIDIVQPDIGWGGGISELRRIADLAIEHKKPVSLHSFGSAIHFAASLHLAASLPNTEVMESEENPNILKTGLIKEPFQHDEKMNFYVPEGPGLGLDIDWEKVNSIRVF